MSLLTLSGCDSSKVRVLEEQRQRLEQQNNILQRQIDDNRKTIETFESDKKSLIEEINELKKDNQRFKLKADAALEEIAALVAVLAEEIGSDEKISHLVRFKSAFARIGSELPSSKLKTALEKLENVVSDITIEVRQLDASIDSGIKYAEIEFEAAKALYIQGVYGGYRFIGEKGEIKERLNKQIRDLKLKSSDQMAEMSKSISLIAADLRYMANR